MRSRVLFSALAFVAFVGTPMALRGQKENPSTTDLTVRQQVDSEISNLDRNLQVKHSLKEKFAKLDKAIQSVQDTRRKNPWQLSDDEIYLDILVKSLQDLPKYSEFNVDSCPSYQRKLIHRWDPRAGSETEDVALKRTLQILADLCAQ